MGSNETKRHFDIIINIPLEEELNAFLNVFDHKSDLSTDKQYRCEVETETNLSMLVLLQDDMGKSSASNSVSEALREFSTNLVVCLGIAGGLSKDLKLGDVCYSGTILDVNDNSKTMDGDNGDIKLELSPFAYETEKGISLALDFIRRDPTLRAQYQDWQDHRYARAEALLLPEISNAKGENPKKALLHSMSGTIACGAVSAGKNYNDKLKQINRKVLAIETESGGVFSVTKRLSIQTLTIRGVSDYANTDKGKLETTTADKVRILAAENASSFLKLQLQNPRFVNKITSSQPSQVADNETAKGPAPGKSLQDLVLGSQAFIDKKLRDLSPEFRLHDRGYQMPMPSLMPERAKKRQDQADDAVAHDILECIRADQHVFISLDKGYPDKSIAWVFADHLIRSEIDGKQILPIVVEGENVRPPHYSIELAAPKAFSDLKKADEHQVVIIFEGLPLSSKTRTKFILEQIGLHKNARFVYVDRTEANFFMQSEFASAVNAKAYRVSDVSFSQIAYFVQRNFDMLGSESEVIAYRLRDTFRKFRLSAHPSYFAGIPKETLSALIQANKRSELMQLGVDGFLSFLVAGDQAQISLSRTTRGKFLRSLIFQMRVEKIQFSESELIEYTNTFAKKFDFDIKAIDFIGEFIRNGILYYDQDKIGVAIPFIENFLLAQELAAKPEEAERYFDLNNFDFDMATFELYCEIQPCDTIVHGVGKILEDAMAGLDFQEHILLGGEIDPASLISIKKLSSLQSKIGKAAKDIVDDKNTTAEKQQLLDISERVSRRTGRSSNAVFNGDELDSDDHNAEQRDKLKELNDEMEAISRLSFASMVGILLLGYGAEHLDAKDKRHLSKLVVGVSSILIDRWTRFHDMIDFEGMRADLTSDENLDEMETKFPSKISREETKSTISDFIDVMRFVCLSDPFRKVMENLVEHARNPILEKSISAIEVDETFAELIRSIWISDLELKDGERPLNEVTRKLPKTSLLRVCIAEHLLKRVYWSHAKKTQRLKLLETAEAVLGAINLSINSKEYKEAIEADSKSKKARKS